MSNCANNGDFQCHIIGGITDEKKEKRYRMLLDTFFDFVNANKVLLELMNQGQIEIDCFLLREVVERYFKDVQRIKCFHPKIRRINEFKIAGYTTYWFCKIRPIVTKTEGLLEQLQKEDLWINEKFVFFISVSRISKELRKQMRTEIGQRYDDFVFHLFSERQDPRFLEEIYYTLRYRSLSADGLTLLYQSIYNGHRNGFYYGFRDHMLKV